MDNRERIFRLKHRIAERLKAKRIKWVEAVPIPRYDEVYFEGTEWLDSEMEQQMSRNEEQSIDHEAVNAVSKINGDIHECYVDGNGYYCVEGWENIRGLIMETDGCTIGISFLDVQLWNSDDDVRKWKQNGFGKEYQEPLVDFLRREITKLLSIISMIKVK